MSMREKKEISLEELWNVLPKEANPKKDVLLTIKNYSKLEFYVRKGWFQTKWLDAIYDEFCQGDYYKKRMSDEEKLDIIFSQIEVEGWGPRCSKEEEEQEEESKNEKKDVIVIYPYPLDEEEPMIEQEQMIEQEEEVRPVEETRKNSTSSRNRGGSYIEADNEYVRKSRPASVAPQDETKQHREETAEEVVEEAVAAVEVVEKGVGEVKETQRVDSVNSSNLSKIRTYLKNSTAYHFKSEEDEIDPWQLNIVKDSPIGFRDDFAFRTGLPISHEYVALMSLDESQVVAVGRLEKQHEKYHVIMEKEDIDFSALVQPYRYKLVLFPFGFTLESKVIPLCTKIVPITLKDLEVTSSTLCIDFGTSNTCAGSYGIFTPTTGEVEIVRFQKKLEESELYPTILYVDDCSDEGNIKYLFGYDALEKVESENYDTKGASVYFELKYFLTALEEIETIHDKKGYERKVPRGELIKAYLQHVIKMSEEYFKTKFKRLHFSCPVKFKNKFYREIKALLEPEGYELLPPHQSLDEGISIVYHSIKKIIESEPEEAIDILILDCGGGTTDLASCAVTFDKRDASTGLLLKSNFVNGNATFGGNNITYRILQLIKMKLVALWKQEPSVEIGKLISHDETSILDYSDLLLSENQSNFHENLHNFNEEIYGGFQRAYEECENVLPTQYRSGENCPSSYLTKKKRNYYYLWQLAEKIKIKFYEKDIVTYELSKKSNQDLELNSDMKEFFVYQDDALISTALGEISITVKELHRLLCGDIYCLLNSLLLKEEKKLQEYSHYKLAGQSCKISLFMELLKEFIPGRHLRRNTKVAKDSSQNSGSLRLKRDCIEGCVQYVRDMEYGKITPKIETNKPKSNYEVSVQKSSANVLISQENPDSVCLIPFGMGTRRVELTVSNTVTSVNRTVALNIEEKLMGGESKSLSEICDLISQESYLEEDMKDNLEIELKELDPKEKQNEDSVLIALGLLSKEGYGFHLYFIKKEKNGDKQSYTLYDSFYENFEDETMMSFFDGSK